LSGVRHGYWAVGVAALVTLAVAGVGIGAVALSPAEVWRALRGAGDPSTVAIVRELRLPRVALAALVGAGLGASGAALQGVLRNALAEPYLLGVSGGAALGAVLLLAAGITFPGVVPLGAFAGAIAAAAVVLGVARAVGGTLDVRLLVMAGVVVGAFANAVVLVALADLPAETTRDWLWWMTGSVSGARWAQVGWLAAYVALGLVLLVAWARDLDALALGEEPAAALGVPVERAARRIFLTGTLLAAATVAAAGLVGFVGLVVPHLARAVGARAHRTLVPAAALVGAVLVVAADLAARTLRAPTELPLGAVTALVGVPFFLHRIWRSRA